MIVLIDLRDDSITPDVSSNNSRDDSIEGSRMIVLPRMYQVTTPGMIALKDLG